MPITATHLVDAGSGDDATSYATASVAPHAYNLLLLAVVSAKATTPEIPTVTGLGLTWVHVAGVSYGSGTDLQRVDVFRAMATSPTQITPGAITITYATTHLACGWSLDQFAGVVTTGANGADAIVQSGTQSATASPGTMVVTLAAFGHANNVPYGAFARNSNANFDPGTGFLLLGYEEFGAPQGGVLTEWKASQDATIDAVFAGDSGAGGVGLEIKAFDTRSSAVKNFRTTDITADVDALATGTETSNSATIARFAAGGTVSSRRFDPGTATGPSAAVPAAPSTAAQMGWRESAGIQSAQPITVIAQTIQVTLRVRRSGQAIEVDQNSDVTVILYRVSSTGTHLAELGRATIRFTWTTTAVDQVVPVPVAATEFNADDRLQVEVYVVTLTAATNLVAAPAVATDLIIQVGASTDSRTPGINYFIRYSRSDSVNGPATAAFSRRVVGSRSFSVSGPSTVAFSRLIAGARSFSVNGAATVAFTRRLLLLRPTSVSGVATVDFARSLVLARFLSVSGPSTVSTMRSIVASRSYSVSGAATAVFSRQLLLARSMSVTGTATAAFSRFIAYLRSYSVNGPATVDFARSIVLSRFTSATGVGAAQSARSIVLALFFSVLGDSTVSTTLLRNYRRDFSVTGTRLVQMRIDMAQAVLNRISGGTPITNVIRKFFTISDD